MVGYYKVSSACEIKEIRSKNEQDHMKESKNTLQVAKSNQQAYMELILSIDHKTASSKAAFGVVKNYNIISRRELQYGME